MWRGELTGGGLLKARRRPWRARAWRALTIVRHPSWLVHPTPRWGGLRRSQPLHPNWGRGSYVDRVYVEAFLCDHSRLITGDVLEVQNSNYTHAFGAHPLRAHVVDIDTTNANATLVADLGRSNTLPDNRFDCIILTQTLHLIADVDAVVDNCRRSLRPGGVLLVTAPAVSRIAPRALGPAAPYQDYWRFTPAGLRTLLERHFAPDALTVTAYGNLTTCIAFLAGMSADELRSKEYDANDPAFPLVVAAVARRTEPLPARRPGAVQLGCVERRT